MDSLDDSLNLWSLYELKKLKLYCNSERVSSRVILLKHDGCEKVLLVDSLDVFLGHGHDVAHDLSACIVQTIELFDDAKQELV